MKRTKIFVTHEDLKQPVELQLEDEQMLELNRRALQKADMERQRQMTTRRSARQT